MVDCTIGRLYYVQDRLFVFMRENMRTITKTTLLAASLLLTSIACNAQWYEAQGHASTERDSVEVARAKAMENA